MPKTFQWDRGQQARLAKESRVSAAYLCDILHRRKTARPEIAARIAEHANRLGIPLTRIDLLYPQESTSPAFHA